MRKWLIALIFVVSCNNLPAPGDVLLDPESASVMAALGIRAIPSIEVQAAVIVTCHVSRVIESLQSGDILDINAVFDGDWDVETTRLANDIRDIFIIQLKNRGLAATGRDKEYFDYVATLLRLTCVRLAPPI